MKTPELSNTRVLAPVLAAVLAMNACKGKQETQAPAADPTEAPAAAEAEQTQAPAADQNPADTGAQAEDQASTETDDNLVYHVGQRPSRHQSRTSKFVVGEYVAPTPEQPVGHRLHLDYNRVLFSRHLEIARDITREERADLYACLDKRFEFAQDGKNFNKEGHVVYNSPDGAIVYEVGQAVSTGEQGQKVIAYNIDATQQQEGDRRNVYHGKGNPNTTYRPFQEVQAACRKEVPKNQETALPEGMTTRN